MIGIFDSGSGGLTVLRQIRNRLPLQDILYFGDLKNAPYGPRSREELSHLTQASIQLLTDKGATHIVSACNSVSASLAAPFDQVLEMTGPAAASFQNSNERILLCATSATVQSGIYQRAFERIGKSITALEIPELAGAIEGGASEDALEKIIKDAFIDIPLQDFDVLVLACTHYPLVAHLFTKMLSDSVRLFDPADAVAKQAEMLWGDETPSSGTLRFLISKDSETFRSFVSKLFPHDAYAIEVIE